jgi:hypothetical protein
MISRTRRPPNRNWFFWAKLHTYDFRNYDDDDARAEFSKKM